MFFRGFSRVSESIGSPRGVNPAGSPLSSGAGILWSRCCELKEWFRASGVVVCGQCIMTVFRTLGGVRKRPERLRLYTVKRYCWRTGQRSRHVRRIPKLVRRIVCGRPSEPNEVSHWKRHSGTYGSSSVSRSARLSPGPVYRAKLAIFRTPCNHIIQSS